MPTVSPVASSFQAAFQKAKRKRLPAPASPPPGTYNPQYDAQARAQQRQYDDLLQNFGIGKTRAQNDLTLALGNLNQSQQNALSDLGTSHDRNLQDLTTNQQYAAQDHATALDALNRNYATLAGRQAEGAIRSGVESAGILAQAIARRNANKANDQAPIDTAYGRQQAAATTAENRINQDYTTNVGRTQQDAQQRQDALKLAFDRAFGPSGDNVLQIARAGRDLTAGNLDLTSQKWYDATANGYAPLVRAINRKKKKVSIV